MAFGTGTFQGAGGAVSDLFSGFGDEIKASGYEEEAGLYGTAASLARNNEKLQASATSIQQVQTERQALKVIGGQMSDVAGSGFQESGTALDLLRDSASQGALAKQLIGEQGAIQENAYETQATSYDALQAAAQSAASAAKTAATGSFIGAGVNAASAIATLFI